MSVFFVLWCFVCFGMLAHGTRANSIHSPHHRCNITTSAKGLRSSILFSNFPRLLKRSFMASPVNVLPSRKLVLHFDVNETIMVGDPAGGDTFEESLNKCICKNAYIKRASTESSHPGKWNEYTWHDGSPLDPSLRQDSSVVPPLITTFETGSKQHLCVYKTAAFKAPYAKSFTESDSPGVIYRSLYEKIEKAMRVPEGCDIDPRLTHDGVHFLILPAFFHTLKQLEGKDFSVIIRTFGTDGPEIAHAIQAWVEGKHPLFPPPSPGFEISFPPSTMFVGRFNEDGEYYLKPDIRTASVDEAEESTTVMDEKSAVSMMAEHKCLMLQDDYFWWRNSGYSPSAGKPLWITSHDERFHPIFFDDNIHNDADDSIVSVRHQNTVGDSFTPLSGEAIRRLQGIFLVRCPTLEPILDHDWFLKQIESCQQKLAAGVDIDSLSRT